MSLCEASRELGKGPVADMSIVHAGHYLKLDIELKGGYVPPGGKFAFPVGIQGLTRSGNQILDGEKVVMVLRKPVAYDAANPTDVRDISSQFVGVNGQTYILFTLPDLTGMSMPVVDPTLTLQPDGAAGEDTYLRSDSATSNYSTLTTLRAGESNAVASVNRALLRFSATSLPGSIRITSVGLSLNVLEDISSNARTMRVFRLLRLWVESEATWNIWKTANNWSTAGGFHANDCEQTDIGSVALSATEGVGSWITIPLSINSRVDLGLINGLMLKMDTENDDMYGFCSSDHATAENRPKLEITYRFLNPVIMF